jgi:hypothetical protein
MDTYPKPDDWRFVSKSDGPMRGVVPGLPIRVTEVDTPDDVPNMPLYWIRGTQQFAVHIGGVLFAGNVGNIYTSFVGRRTAVRDCDREDSKDHNPDCRFYHKPGIRNYTTASWLYTDAPLSRRNRNMRHVGNRNTLISDLYAMKISPKTREMDIRLDQLMHDLLVLMAANKCGLLTQNPDIEFSDTPAASRLGADHTI